MNDDELFAHFIEIGMRGGNSVDLAQAVRNASSGADIVWITRIAARAYGLTVGQAQAIINWIESGGDEALRTAIPSLRWADQA
jgi:hypothetical protein